MNIPATTALTIIGSELCFKVPTSAIIHISISVSLTSAQALLERENLGRKQSCLSFRLFIDFAAIPQTYLYSATKCIMERRQDPTHYLYGQVVGKGAKGRHQKYSRIVYV